MKKLLLCIGVFLVLFFMTGVYTSQAQDFAALNQMNGKWLKFNGSIKGYDFGTYHDPAGEAVKLSGTLNQIYACVLYNPANEYADMNLYNKVGTQIGWGFFYWESGTTDTWLSMTNIFLVSSGRPYPTYDTDVGLSATLIAKTTNAAEKGTFKSLGLQGDIENDTSFGRFGGSMKANIVTKLPFTPPACGWVGP